MSGNRRNSHKYLVYSEKFDKDVKKNAPSNIKERLPRSRQVIKSLKEEIHIEKLKQDINMILDLSAKRKEAGISYKGIANQLGEKMGKKYTVEDIYEFETFYKDPTFLELCAWANILELRLLIQ